MKRERGNGEERRNAQFNGGLVWVGLFKENGNVDDELAFLDVWRRESRTRGWDLDKILFLFVKQVMYDDNSKGEVYLLCFAWSWSPMLTQRSHPLTLRDWSWLVVLYVLFRCHVSNDEQVFVCVGYIYPCCWDRPGPKPKTEPMFDAESFCDCYGLKAQS